MTKPLTKARTLIAAAAILFAAGCTPPQPPPVSPRLMAEWSFQPPRGWEAFTLEGPLRPPLPGMRSWRTSFPPQIISLSVMSQRHLQSLRNFQMIMFGPFFVAVTRITLCHGLPGLLAHQRAPFGMSIDDSVAMQQPGSAATASYTYPRFSSPEPDAEASIRSLCPRRS
jgi:hypothetical protein